MARFGLHPSLPHPEISGQSKVCACLRPGCPYSPEPRSLQSARDRILGGHSEPRNTASGREHSRVAPRVPESTPSSHLAWREGSCWDSFRPLANTALCMQDACRALRDRNGPCWVVTCKATDAHSPLGLLREASAPASTGEGATTAGDRKSVV